MFVGGVKYNISDDFIMVSFHGMEMKMEGM
jgi:hypothetical protein